MKKVWVDVDAVIPCAVEITDEQYEALTADDVNVDVAGEIGFIAMRDLMRKGAEVRDYYYICEEDGTQLFENV